MITPLPLLALLWIELRGTFAEKTLNVTVEDATKEFVILLLKLVKCVHQPKIAQWPLSVTPTATFPRTSLRQGKLALTMINPHLEAAVSERFATIVLASQCSLYLSAQ